MYWQATEAGNDEIAESILDLSQLFRLVLNQGKSVVTIEQETDLVTHYLQIQKMRFPRKINYEINIAPEVAKVRIPKLILQPFVEMRSCMALKCQLGMSAYRDSGETGETPYILKSKIPGIGMKQGTISSICGRASLPIIPK